MRSTGVLIAVAIGINLGACVSSSDRRAATIKGACDSFVPPPHAIKGKTRSDQRWISGTVESGVSACGWARPAPHPDDVKRARRAAGVS
jgi:hypothetical protein